VYYGFEAQINGLTIPGSNSSVRLSSGCNATQPEFWNPYINNNPTVDSWVFLVKTNQEEKINIRIFDAIGRRVDELNIQPNTDYIYGSKLSRGIYFVEFSQGKNRKTLKAIKL
jgi:hypothetical protein